MNPQCATHIPKALTNKTIPFKNPNLKDSPYQPIHDICKEIEFIQSVYANKYSLLQPFLCNTIEMPNFLNYTKLEEISQNSSFKTPSAYHHFHMNPIQVTQFYTPRTPEILEKLNTMMMEDNQHSSHTLSSPTPETKNIKAKTQLHDPHS